MDFKKEEYILTTNINEAIFMDKYGNLMDGEFDMGMRGLDHNCIIPYHNDNRTHQEKWESIHKIGIIRLVPETKIALISINQKITKKQQEMLTNSCYKLEKY